MAIKWNCTEPNSDVTVTISMEPVAFVFIIVFGVLLAVQFTCLLIHQSFSFLQIVSSVKLSCKKHTDVETMTPEERQVNSQNIIELARKMQVPLPGNSGSPDSNLEQPASVSDTDTHSVPRGKGTSLPPTSASLASSPTRRTNRTSTESGAFPGNNSTLGRAFAASYMAIANDHRVRRSGRFASTIRNLQQVDVFSEAGVEQVGRRYNVQSVDQAVQRRRLSVMFEPLPDYD